MKRLTKQSDADEKVESYHSTDMVASMRIVQAISNAQKAIAEDVRGLLETFQYKGGFRTREEARAYLDEPISEASKRYMIGRIKRGKLSKRDIRRYLTRLGAPSTKAHMTRRQSIAAILGINAPSIAEAIRGEADPFLRKTVTEAYGRQSFEIQKGLSIAINTDMPTMGTVRAIATRTLSATTSMADQVTEEMRAQIIEQVLQGKPTYDIIEKVASGTGTEVWRAKRLVRTVITEASAEAETEALKDAGFGEYEYIATKDERTCPVCGRLDGRVYKLDSKKPGVNFPPMHPNCRCTIGTVMEDREREQYKKSARDREGKTIRIPASWTYEDWAKRYYPEGYKASRAVSLK
jgi:SPP1 gp7 family putative phage head morphogenesis protein